MSDDQRRSGDAVRAFNRGRVLDAVRAATGATRADLVARTSLSRSTVTSIVAELLADERLVETTSPPTSRGPGRPSRVLSLAPSSDLVIAVDFGHSHCRVGLVDHTGTVVAEYHRRLDVDSSARVAMEFARTATERLLRTRGVDRDRVVGGAIGLPAPVDVSTGSIGPGNVLPRWVDRRPAGELGDALGIVFAVDNDANLGALGEWRHGAGRGHDDLIYVKAATGVGAGFVLGGRLHRGSTGRAGEIGHVPVDTTGPACRCGNRGCLETVASVNQVLAALAPRDHRRMTATRVADLVRAGDVGAARVVGDAGRMIGRVLADTVNNLNPSIVVLGGELAAFGAPLLDGVRESIVQFGQPEITGVMRVGLGELGERSELLGAAVLARQLRVR